MSDKFPKINSIIVGHFNARLGNIIQGLSDVEVGDRSDWVNIIVIERFMKGKKEKKNILQRRGC